MLCFIIQDGGNALGGLYTTNIEYGEDFSQWER